MSPVARRPACAILLQLVEDRVGWARAPCAPASTLPRIRARMLLKSWAIAARQALPIASIFLRLLELRFEQLGPRARRGWTVANPTWEAAAVAHDERAHLGVDELAGAKSGASCPWAAPASELAHDSRRA